jgi:hypothetical protein
MEVWCVSWFDNDNKRHIEWNVPDPWYLEQKLIEKGVDKETIDIYEKDVS